MNRPISLFWLLTAAIGLLLVPVGVLSAQTPAGDAGFEEANKLYAQARYTEAAAAYEQLLKSGKASEAVYFNLGNAYFKAGQIGRALAEYRQAEGLAPRDPDVQANIRFARNRVQGLTSDAPAWQSKLGKLSLNEWALAASVGFWICCLILISIQVRPALKTVLKTYLIAGAAVTLLLCACLGLTIYERRQPVAIITAAEAPVHQAPLAESGNVFTAHDGAEMRIVDRKGDWLQVTTGPNRTGWIGRDQVLVLNDG